MTTPGPSPRTIAGSRLGAVLGVAARRLGVAAPAVHAAAWVLRRLDPTHEALTEAAGWHTPGDPRTHRSTLSDRGERVRILRGRPEQLAQVTVTSDGWVACPSAVLASTRPIGARVRFTDLDGCKVAGKLTALHPSVLSPVWHLLMIDTDEHRSFGYDLPPSHPVELLR